MKGAGAKNSMEGGRVWDHLTQGHIFQVGKQTQSKVVALPSSLGVEMNERPSLLTSIQCPFYYCSEDKSKEGVCTCMCVSVCVRECACVHMSTGTGEPYLGIKLCTG